MFHALCAWKSLDNKRESKRVQKRGRNRAQTTHTAAKAQSNRSSIEDGDQAMASLRDIVGASLTRRRKQVVGRFQPLADFFFAAFFFAAFFLADFFRAAGFRAAAFFRPAPFTLAAFFLAAFFLATFAGGISSTHLPS